MFSLFRWIHRTPVGQSETAIIVPGVFRFVSVSCLSEDFNVYVDGAAEQRAKLQSFPRDVEQRGRSLLQVIALCDSSGKILEALNTRTSGQSLVRTVHPAGGDAGVRTSVLMVWRDQGNYSSLENVFININFRRSDGSSWSFRWKWQKLTNSNWNWRFLQIKSCLENFDVVVLMMLNKRWIPAHRWVKVIHISFYLFVFQVCRHRVFTE